MRHALAIVLAVLAIAAPHAAKASEYVHADAHPTLPADETPRIDDGQAIAATPFEVQSSVRQVGTESNSGPTGRLPARGSRALEPGHAAQRAAAARSRAATMHSLDFFQKLALERAGLTDWHATAPPPVSIS